ncbi:MAG: acetyl-CoA carboxylase, carboxyltransferase subunit beta [Hyphomicrobiales bacterium]|nr:acetyl-CoA carboxylase, carboxyltransferase subunit beta [Hyphomicrobiales bacterium]
MNWINNVVRPKIRGLLQTKKELPDNLWVKCPETGQMVFHKDLEANQFVIPGSGHHMRMGAEARLKLLFDGGKYDRIAMPEVAADPLKFRDEKRYADRLKDARTKTGMDDAVIAGTGFLDGVLVVSACQDFSFLGGSLGMAAGEAIVTAMMKAAELKAPFIFFVSSGGARMQEGILSLMQMPRTTVAIHAMNAARCPYIVVLTHPTTGGVTASYAMLGDIHIAEPGALIGFAGPRVIEQTIREKLPEGFQRSEYLLDKGMIDMVVHRHQMRETLSRICRILAAAKTRRAEMAAARRAAAKPQTPAPEKPAPALAPPPEEAKPHAGLPALIDAAPLEPPTVANGLDRDHHAAKPLG